MKKITFLVVALCATLFASAASYTLIMSDYEATSFTTPDGFSIAAAQLTGASAPVYNATSFDLRVYANNTLTITSTEPMTSISFELSAQGKRRLATVSANTGNVAIKGDPDFTVVWSGNATTVILTVGEKSTYGSDGATKAGQLDFTEMTIVTNAGGDDPDPVAEYPIVEGQATYFGTAYSTNQNFAVDLFSDLQFDAEGYPTVDGVWMSFDLFTATDKFFQATYVIGEDDVLGNAGTTYSGLTKMVGADTTTVSFVSGVITIAWVSGDFYNVIYDVVDENSVQYAGTVKNIEILAYTEAGESYVITNEGDETVGESPMVEAEITYSPSYSSEAGQNFYLGLYSDMVWVDGGLGYLVPTSAGNYLVVDLYAPTATSFVGTYTFDALDTYAAGTFSSEYSYWAKVNAAGDVTELFLTGGSVTITANGAGSYTITYSVTDETNTAHTGSLTYNISIWDEDDNDYSGSIDDDGTAICHVEASLEVYTRGGHIVVPAAAGERITVYNMMGQTLYTGVAQSGETTVAGLSANQVLVVRAGNKTAKVVL